MKFYSVDFIRKCVFLLKKEYFLLSLNSATL